MVAMPTKMMARNSLYPVMATPTSPPAMNSTRPGPGPLRQCLSKLCGVDNGTVLAQGHSLAPLVTCRWTPRMLTMLDHGYTTPPTLHGCT